MMEGLQEQRQNAVPLLPAGAAAAPSGAASPALSASAMPNSGVLPGFPSIPSNGSDPGLKSVHSSPLLNPAGGTFAPRPLPAAAAAGAPAWPWRGSQAPQQPQQRQPPWALAGPRLALPGTGFSRPAPSLGIGASPDARPGAGPGTTGLQVQLSALLGASEARRPLLGQSPQDALVASQLLEELSAAPWPFAAKQAAPSLDTGARLCPAPVGATVQAAALISDRPAHASPADERVATGTAAAVGCGSVVHGFAFAPAARRPSQGPSCSMGPPQAPLTLPLRQERDRVPSAASVAVAAHEHGGLPQPLSALRFNSDIPSVVELSTAAAAWPAVPTAGSVHAELPINAGAGMSVPALPSNSWHQQLPPPPPPPPQQQQQHHQHPESSIPVAGSSGRMEACGPGVHGVAWALTAEAAVVGTNLAGHHASPFLTMIAIPEEADAADSGDMMDDADTGAAAAAAHTAARGTGSTSAGATNADGLAWRGSGHAPTFSGGAAAAGGAGGGVRRGRLSDKAGGDALLARLRQAFELPTSEAARSLGVSTTELKRRCRQLNIRRWPQRKLQSLRRIVEAAEEDEQLSEEARQEVREQVARNRAEIMERPDAPLLPALLSLRQSQYKQAHDKRVMPSSRGGGGCSSDEE